MNVRYTFLDKLRQFFGLGPTAATVLLIEEVAAAKTLAAAQAKAAKAAAEKKVPAAKKPVALKKGAVDGDGDGLVQDGTTHERPAKKKPSSSGGGGISKRAI